MIKRARSAEKVAEYRAQLRVPPRPPAYEHLWDAFVRMRRRKPGAPMGGVQPLEMGDIANFLRLTGQRLAPWEVEVIEGLDDAYLGATAKEI